MVPVSIEGDIIPASCWTCVCAILGGNRFSRLGVGIIRSCLASIGMDRGIQFDPTHATLVKFDRRLEVGFDTMSKNWWRGLDKLAEALAAVSIQISEPTRIRRNSYAGFRLKKKKKKKTSLK